MCFSHRQGTVQACTEDSDQEGRKLTLLCLGESNAKRKSTIFISEVNMMLHVVYVISHFVQKKHINTMHAKYKIKYIVNTLFWILLGLTTLSASLSMCKYSLYIRVRNEVSVVDGLARLH